MITIDKREVYRYLGYRMGKTVVNPAVDQMIDDCIETMQQVATPRYAYKLMPLSITDQIITIGDMTIESCHLCRNLQGCHGVYLMAATIGMGVDRLIKRANLTDIPAAAIYQAIGSAMAESVVDSVNDEIKRIEAKKGYYCHPRYSPGYGDCDLSTQKPFLSYFKNDQLGITLTDTYLMIPSKSVTAFIGVSDQPWQSTASPCDECTQINCRMRKETS